jgi:hypothetical protein
MRVMVGQPAVVRIYIENEDGALIAVDDNTDVDVVVNNGAGAPLATGVGVADSMHVGVYRFTLAPQARLDTLDVTATAMVNGVLRMLRETVQVVGTRLVPKWRLAQDPVAGVLDPVSLELVLGAVEDLVRQTLGFSAVWEGVRVNFDEHRRGASDSYNPMSGMSYGSPGGERLIVPGVAYPQEVYSLIVNGQVVGDEVLASIHPGNGALVWGQSWPSGNYQMWLTHGLDNVPGDLVEAAFTLCRYGARKLPKASKDNNAFLSERASSITTEGATLLFSLPTPDRPTGLPEVDAVLARYRDESVI